jgi:ABC-type transport system involved in multi-copper enzyme maturation permease subunit
MSLVSSSTADLKAMNSRTHQGVNVPASWRIGQVVVSLLIIALAVYFNTKGWMTGPKPVPGDARTLLDQLGFVVLLAITWLTTPTVFVIANTTFQESVRKRWLLVLLIGSLVLLASSVLFVGIQPGSETALLRDYCTGFIIAMTMLMAIFLGVSLVPPEIERRTIFTILSKPVNRMEFILGKFMGLCLTLLVNLVLMVLIFFITYILFEIRRQGYAGAMDVDLAAQHPGMKFDVLNLTNAFVLHFGQLTIMAALSLVLSLVVSHITALVGAFVIYFAGQMSSYWGVMGTGHGEDTVAQNMPKAAQGAMHIMYFLLPRLDRFDVRTQLVTETPVFFNYVWKSWSAGLVYTGALLLIGYLVFSDREF